MFISKLRTEFTSPVPASGHDLAEPGEVFAGAAVEHEAVLSVEVPVRTAVPLHEAVEEQLGLFEGLYGVRTAGGPIPLPSVSPVIIDPE